MKTITIELHNIEVKDMKKHLEKYKLDSIEDLALYYVIKSLQEDNVGAD